MRGWITEVGGQGAPVKFATLLFSEKFNGAPKDRDPPEADKSSKGG